MVSSLLISFSPATTRVFAATSAKGTSSSGGGGSKEEESLIDFILGKITKQDQFYETDPILRRGDEAPTSTSTTTSVKGGKGGTTSGRNKNSVSVPQKKKFGGFGGLFAKKDE